LEINRLYLRPGRQIHSRPGRRREAERGQANDQARKSAGRHGAGPRRTVSNQGKAGGGGCGGGRVQLNKNSCLFKVSPGPGQKQGISHTNTDIFLSAVNGRGSIRLTRNRPYELKPCFAGSSPFLLSLR